MLTLVIVSFNSFKAAHVCMDELLSSGRFDVIIVDNASTDDSVALFKRTYPNVKLLALETNIGYGRAANKAFEEVETDYALLLNPDMLASVDSILALEKRMETLDDTVALLAPSLRSQDYEKRGLIEMDRIIGAAMLFNMRVVESVGFFDENIFLFSEETELCYRLKNAGFTIYLDSDIFMEHLAKQSSTPSAAVDYIKSWHFGWSRIYFYEKYGLATGQRKAWRILLRYGIKMLISFRQKKRTAYKARFLGTLAYVQGESAFLDNGKAQKTDLLSKH